MKHYCLNLIRLNKKMKKIVLFLAVLALLIVSCTCSRGSLSHEPKEPDSMLLPLKPDTVVVVDSMKIDSLFNILKSTQDSLQTMKDSVIFYRDTILYENYINARRIEKIKYYIDICEKRSANKKYFFGWTKRAISE